MLRPRQFLLAIGVLVAIASPAAAERAALFLGASARDVDRPALIEIARAEAEAAGWTVTEPPLGDVALSDLLTCVAAGQASDCIPGHLDDNDVDRGIVISVSLQTTKSKKNWVVNGWVFRRTGDLLITDRRYCEGCKIDKLGDTVRELTETLIREARARAKPTVIVARSRPAGARVFVDDKEVGATEVEVPVYAGIHAVRFELDGHVTEVREVVIGDGESLAVDVTLKKDAAEVIEQPDPITMPPDDGPPSRLLPFSLIGGGVALLVTGGIVFALDESPVKDGDQVPSYTDTTLPAVGLLAVGAVATGLGTYLLLRARSHRPSETPTKPAPVVSVASGTAWVGVVGRF